MTGVRFRLPVVLLLLLPVGLACSGHGFRGAGRPEPEILRVGTSGDYAPFSLQGRGFDLEVAELLARDLGARVELVPFRWPELQDDVAADRFDVAMSGVTWRPARSVIGYMTRAYAVGGPCLVADRAPPERGAFDTVVVNRGGILERWARRTLAASTLVTTDDNLSLPQFLTDGKADAFVTDSFEVAHLSRPSQYVVCEPATDRKSYWVAPARARDLGPEIDRWLLVNEAALAALRDKHFGEPLPRSELHHLVDLISRRLEFMPEVAAWKRANDRAIEDLAQERRVLASASEAARRHGLEQRHVEELFRLQIDLAKAIQQRTPPDKTTDLDLEGQIRPQLIALGDRILESLAAVSAPGSEARRLSPIAVDNAFEPLSGILLPEEMVRLRTFLDRI